MAMPLRTSARSPLRSTAECLGAVAVLLLASGHAIGAQAPGAARSDRIDWLQKNAAPIRTVDPADNNFDDLAALGAAIGNSQMVLLGEQSHGDGTVFLAKTRIIRYLHEKLGFDVLAFESGLYDVPKAWSYLKAGESADSAVRRGVFSIWTGSKEFQPLIGYIGQRMKSDRPLEITGFDNQFTATASRQFFLTDLRAFLVGNKVDTATIVSWSHLTSMVGRLQAGDWYRNKPKVEEYERFIVGWQDLRRRVGQLPASDTAAAYWRQLLESTEAFAEQMYTYNPAAMNNANRDMSAINLRDIQMGKNLLWLAREKYPNRKIIVWAATFHNLRNPSSINTGPTNMYRGVVTMGHVVSSTLSNRVYSIGFIASEGTAGAWMRESRVLSPVPAESLEGMLASTKHDNAFIDFRAPAVGGEWLRSRMKSGPLGYGMFEADWSRVLDGMFYTRTMARSTKAN